MSQNLTISETGLKLIKAFEGYRPVDRELISGQRIVGYGHRLYSEDAVMMNKEEAEAVLKSDLEPFEEMINTEVHAPITQSQFDALCSFAYNIGPKAFLESDTLRALNNGRPLDAANGLDVWRKSEIAGKTYVVDALMRRRTAEKALFLRADRYVPAGREDLPPVQDTTISGLSTEDALPVFTEDDANGFVSTVPYTAKNTPMRRREDGPAGALQLSELDIIEDTDLAEAKALEESLSKSVTDVETVIEPKEVQLTEDVVSLAEEVELNPQDEDLPKSPIAAAASDIVARLDALIEDAGPELDNRDEQWPDSLIKAELMPEEETQTSPSETGTDAAQKANVIDLTTREKLAVDVEASVKEDMDTDNIIAADMIVDKESELDEPNNPVTVIDELAQDDAFRVRTDSASKYIETYTPTVSEQLSEKKIGAGLWIPVILGFTLLGAAAGAMGRGAEALLGEWGPIIAFTGIVIGVGLILAGIYATLRINSRN